MKMLEVYDHTIWPGFHYRRNSSNAISNNSGYLQFISGIALKIVDTYSIKTFVLLHFENKNDFTVIAKLSCRATSLWRIAPRSLIMIVMSFLVMRLSIKIVQSWRKERNLAKRCIKEWRSQVD